jgi:hypothetical protein
VSDPAYNPDRFISDTATGDVDQYRCPVPPSEWGPGSMVRLVAHRGWQWVAPPPPRARWEPMQPPPAGARPIAIGLWDDGARAVTEPATQCTVRLRRDVDTNGPRAADGSGFEYITLAIAQCDVATWEEARPKCRVGTLGLKRAQAEYLRDALTAMLERKP